MFFRIIVFMCWLFGTYSIYFLQDEFILFMINNIIILLLNGTICVSCGVITAVLGRSASRILWTKVFQDLGFFWWIPRAMDDTSMFLSILCMIYIPFFVLGSVLTHLVVSICQGELSSHFTFVTRMVGILLSRFFNKKVLQQLHK